MSRIRSKNTRVELVLRQALWRLGLRYRIHYRVTGSPDIAFVRQKVAVFCDSTFWHGRDWEKKKARLVSRRDYWIARIERNINRDRRVDDELRQRGWRVLRFWEDDVYRKLNACVEQIREVLDAK